MTQEEGDSAQPVQQEPGKSPQGEHNQTCLLSLPFHLTPLVTQKRKRQPVAENGGLLQQGQSPLFLPMLQVSRGVNSLSVQGVCKLACF